jgi:hypothetical protein
MPDFLQRLLAWWHRDAIRVSPREGRLLRLQPPCIINIDEHEILVEKRTVADHPQGAQVIYDGHIRSNRRATSLTIAVGSSNVAWTIDGSTLNVAVDEIIAFEPTSRYRALTQVSADDGFA